MLTVPDLPPDCFRGFLPLVLDEQGNGDPGLRLGRAFNQRDALGCWRSSPW